MKIYAIFSTKNLRIRLIFPASYETFFEFDLFAYGHRFGYGFRNGHLDDLAFAFLENQGDFLDSALANFYGGFDPRMRQRLEENRFHLLGSVAPYGGRLWRLLNPVRPTGIYGRSRQVR
mgnify:CR=1 FL=1